MALATSILIAGTRGAQPAASAANNGCYYRVTDEGNIVEQSTGASWVGIGAEVDLTSGVSGVLPVANGGTGSASGAGLLVSVTTLTNAEIQNLGIPTPKTLIAAPSAGFWNHVIAGSIHLNATAGGYGNVTAASGDLTVQTADGNWLLVNIANDTTLATPLTRLTTYLTSAANTIVHLPEYSEAVQYGTTGDWGYVQPIINYPVPASPQAVVLSMTNAAGVLSGGNVANSMKVTLLYRVEAL